MAEATITAGESTRISRCSLSVCAQPWAYARRHEGAIAAHWQATRIARPKLFDGTVYLMRDYTLKGDELSGTLLPTDFKSFLYWREQGYPECGVHDAFGASVIRSAEGYVLLGRQSEGNLNAGLVYPPSGMIDQDDVCEGGIDIDASITRELGEETGLRPHELERVPGFLLTRLSPFVAIAIEWRSALAGEALRERILAHVRRQAEPELADVLVVRSPAELERIAVQSYARPLLRLVMSA